MKTFSAVVFDTVRYEVTVVAVDEDNAVDQIKRLMGDADAMEAECLVGEVIETEIEEMEQIHDGR